MRKKIKSPKLQIKNAAKHAIGILDLPLPDLINYPSIEMTGNKSIRIGGVKGVLCFENGEIKLNCGKNIIQITGSSLTVRALSDECLLIEGQIAELRFN